MADLTEIQASQSIKIAGVDILSGLENYYTDVTSEGKLKTEQTPDIAGRDAFGRQRMSVPQIIFNINHAHGAHDTLFNTTTVSGGTSAFNSAISSNRISVPTTSGASVLRQTKRYVRYVAGRSFICTIAIESGAKKTNVRKRWGTFDNLNGMFLEDDGVNLKAVIRTDSSGSAVDTAVNQSSWNIDKLDGTGPSGITLDLTKHQVWIIDFVWHGGGPVRFGLHFNGKINYVHQVIAANISADPFTRSPLYPIRYEITNTGTSASTTNFDCTAMSATLEGSGNDFIPTYNFSASNGLTSRSISQTFIPLISIRPKTTLNGVINRSLILPSDFEVTTAAAVMHVQIVVNPTLTGASFTSVNSISATEYDVSATAVSGGTVVYETYVTSAGKSNASISSNIDQFILGLDIAGTVQDIFTVQVKASTSNQATYGAIRWSEYQ